MKKYDMINHPAHYISKNGLEVIDVIQEFTEGLTGIIAVCMGNIIKYVLRWNRKGGVEDLKKARFYLDKVIAMLDKEAAVKADAQDISKNTTEPEMPTIDDLVALDDETFTEVMEAMPEDHLKELHKEIMDERKEEITNAE